MSRLYLFLNTYLQCAGIQYMKPMQPFQAFPAPTGLGSPMAPPGPPGPNIGALAPVPAAAAALPRSGVAHPPAAAMYDGGGGRV